MPWRWRSSTRTGANAAYWNIRHKSCGHVWQGRYYSCPLDAPHLWAALRYAELNPVRAGLVAQPEAWAWSSAAAHSGTAPADIGLAMDLWKKLWTFAEWHNYLGAGETEMEVAEIRQSTHTGRPLGTSEFIAALEKILGRQLAPQKGGRTQRPGDEGTQEPLMFEP